jgi:hypothetical protein
MGLVKPMRFAYADPPYPGYAGYYKNDPRAAEVDHAKLIGDLYAQFPDGWALSTYTNQLRNLLPLCNEDIRTLAWVKPWCSWKPGNRVTYAWEPVIVHGGRKKLPGRNRTVRDWVAVNMTQGTGLIGAKPRKFAQWVFDVLGALPGDELVDMYPGTGGVTRAWKDYTARRTLEVDA